jgi:hypothetical protein
VTFEQAITVAKDVGIPLLVIVWVLFVFVPKHLDRFFVAVEGLKDSTIKAQSDQREATLKVAAGIEQLAKDVAEIGRDVDEVRRDQTDPRIRRAAGGEGGK